MKKQLLKNEEWQNDKDKRKVLNELIDMEVWNQRENTSRYIGRSSQTRRPKREGDCELNEESYEYRNVENVVNL